MPSDRTKARLAEFEEILLATDKDELTLVDKYALKAVAQDAGMAVSYLLRSMEFKSKAEEGAVLELAKRLDTIKEEATDRLSKSA